MTDTENDNNDTATAELVIKGLEASLNFTNQQLAIKGLKANIEAQNVYRDKLLNENRSQFEEIRRLKDKITELELEQAALVIDATLKPEDVVERDKQLHIALTNLSFILGSFDSDTDITIQNRAKNIEIILRNLLSKS